MHELTFAEMFCGIGGFRLGLERAGWRCVWANDVDRWACSVYRRHFGGGGLVEGDVRQVDAGSIPDHALLTAGFPCQSFSVAGRRKGFEDARGTLFYDIARVAAAKRPPLLLLENVKGLLSNDGGRTFERILEVLDELGYDVEWQVLNSKDFGVPQNRERVFVVGHLRGSGTREVFPLGEVPEGAAGARGEAQEEGARLRTAGALCAGGSGRERNLIASVGQEGGRGGGRAVLVLGSIYPSGGQAGRVVDPAGAYPALRAGDKTGMQPVALCGAGARLRRLTPRECERLQGFPDDWTRWGATPDGRTVEISDTRRYRLLGNAVTVSVVEYLGGLLRGCLQ